MLENLIEYSSSPQERSMDVSHPSLMRAANIVHALEAQVGAGIPHMHATGALTEVLQGKKNNGVGSDSDKVGAHEPSLADGIDRQELDRTDQALARLLDQALDPEESKELLKNGQLTVTHNLDTGARHTRLKAAVEDPELPSSSIDIITTENGAERTVKITSQK